VDGIVNIVCTGGVEICATFFLDVGFEVFIADATEQTTWHHLPEDDTLHSS
jgi:hypothetical protein